MHIIPFSINLDIHKDFYVTCIFCTTCMQNAGKLVHTTTGHCCCSVAKIDILFCLFETKGSVLSLRFFDFVAIVF